MRPSLHLPLALSGGWIVMGIAAGVLQQLAGGPSLVGSRAALPLAGVLWVPLTFAAVALARKVPWAADGRLRFLVVHGTAAALAGFVLNGAWYAVALLIGAVPADAVVEGTLRSGVQWAHLHAAAWFVVVAAAHVVDGAGAQGAVPTEAGSAAPGPAPAAGPPAGAPATDVAPPAEAPALVVSKGRGGVRVPYHAIAWIEADGDYARVHADGRNWLVSRRMRELEDELDGHGFVRVHRSAIVSLRKVREVRHRSHGDFEAELADGTVVRVSRTRRGPLLEALDGARAE